MSYSLPRKANIPDHVRLPDHLVLGIEVLDQQHRLLLAQLDALNRKAESQTLSSEVMGECAYVIGQALLEHFKTEEDVMRRMQVPDDCYARHADDHQRILSEYVALQERIMAQPQTKIREVLQTIENWIVTHLAEFDAPAFRTDAVKPNAAAR